MHHVKTTVAQDQRLRWSTTLALLAVQKLANRRPLALAEKEALVRLADDFRSVARKTDDVHGDVLLMRRMSGSRISGNLRRLLAMNSPKMSALEPEVLERAARTIDSLADEGFSEPAAAVGSLQDIQSACEELLRAI